MQKQLVMLMSLAVGACSAPEKQPPKEEVFTDAQLAPPETGKGFQLTTGGFDVAPGLDLQQCFFFQVPGNEGEEVFVNKFVMEQNDGTHHMNIFRVNTIVDLGPEGGLVQRAENGRGPCFDSGNWADWPLVVNSQVGGHEEWELPAGVAHKFVGGEWLMLQSHYVNASTQETPGRGNVFVNFYTVPGAQVQHELGSLFATKQSIRICQHEDASKFHGTCQFDSDQPVHIIAANGHFHSRGTRFEMYTWDGVSVTQPGQEALFYVSESWEDPPMMRNPELDRVVQPGGGIWYTCEFEWRPPPPEFGCQKLNEEDTKELGTPAEAYDCCYTFGGPVDWAEHCNVFTYFYPKNANVTCY